MLWEMWWASKIIGEWGRERGRWGNWDKDSEPVQGQTQGMWGKIQKYRPCDSIPEIFEAERRF